MGRYVDRERDVGSMTVAEWLWRLAIQRADDGIVSSRSTKRCNTLHGGTSSQRLGAHKTRLRDPRLVAKCADMSEASQGKVGGGRRRFEVLLRFDAYRSVLGGVTELD